MPKLCHKQWKLKLVKSKHIFTYKKVMIKQEGESEINLIFPMFLILTIFLESTHDENPFIN